MCDSMNACMKLKNKGFHAEVLAYCGEATSGWARGGQERVVKLDGCGFSWCIVPHARTTSAQNSAEVRYKNEVLVFFVVSQV